MTRMDDPDGFERFRLNYRHGRVGVLAEIEFDVIGAVYGANGYTTRAQADRLAAVLELGRGSRLLDLGTGCGWPALYLSETTGCEVVATDVPFEGLEQARDLILTRGLPASAVQSSAPAPPFAARSFDAITHTDVLC